MKTLTDLFYEKIDMEHVAYSEKDRDLLFRCFFLGIMAVKDYLEEVSKKDEATQTLHHEHLLKQISIHVEIERKIKELKELNDEMAKN